MSKDRAHDDAAAVPRTPSAAPTRTLLVAAHVGSSDDDFVPGAPTRLQPTPVHTETSLRALDDDDDETMTNLSPVIAAAVSRPNADDDLDVEVDVDAAPAARDVDAVAPPDPVRGYARDASTQVDFRSVHSDEYSISGDDEITDAHLHAAAREEAERDRAVLAEFVDAIAPDEGALGPEDAFADVPTASHFQPIVDDAVIPSSVVEAPVEAPAVDVRAQSDDDMSLPASTPVPREAMARTMASVHVDTPATELEHDALPELAKWRVVPTGWDAQPSYYAPRVPEATPEQLARKVHTVLWTTPLHDGDAPDAPVESARSYAGEPDGGRFRDATGANQLASVYVHDALAALDELAVHTHGLEPEARRAAHAALYAVAQKLRRALSLLDAPAPEGHDEG